MRINNNLMAMNTHRQLGINSSNGAKSIEKLSSGLRINRAGDDAAGLAISEKMRSQIRGLNQASRNSQDGISLVQTAEGALQESQAILQRMRELAVQSSNDTNTGEDRGQIQEEMNQLTSEINRIGSTTEFNKQKLLKGVTTEVVATDAAVATATAGEAGVSTGEIGALNTTANSVVGVDSTASVQASKAAATGVIDSTVEVTPSVKGAKSQVTVSNGITFSAADLGTTLNGRDIEITQKSGNSQTSAVTFAGGKYTFQIGTNGSGDSLATNRGELYNELKASIDASVDTTDVKGIIDLEVPSNTAEVVNDVAATGTLASGVAETAGVYTSKISDIFEEAGDTVTIAGETFTGKSTGADASSGEFNIDAIHSSSTSSVAVDETVDLTGLVAGEFKVAVEGTDYTINNATLATWDGSGLDKTKDDLLDFIKTNLSTGGDGTGTLATDELDITLNDANKLEIIAKTAGTADTVVVTVTAGNTAPNTVEDAFSTTANFTDVDGAATGATLDDQSMSLRVAMNANSNINTNYSVSGNTTAGEIQITEKAGKASGVALADAVVAGSGQDDKLVITNTGGQNLGKIVIDQAVGDTLAAVSTAGTLTISLANATPSKNSAAAIEALVQGLGTLNGTDYSKFEFSAEGEWDTNTTGNSITTATGTLVGGTEEVKGSYNFDVDTAFAAGDIVEVKGQTFTAVDSGAKASAGEFNVSAGDTIAQAAGLADAISLNDTLKADYATSTSGSTITLVEQSATGTDLQASELEVKATGTAGEFSVEVSELADGAAFVLDGQEITVSSQNEHVGYADGTAVKAADGDAAQTAAVADAINLNAELNTKYTASVDDGKLVLTQKSGEESATAPAVATKNSDIGDFSAKLQIGANTDQSMSVNVGDMRASGLDIAGDGSQTTIAASNGKVASYTETAAVTDGETEDKTQFALDISTAEKATAAISVLDDAINTVSTQRAKLGALQNRLEHTIKNLDTSSENLQAAESRIRDVDMAKEMMTFTKNNILQQAAQSMLAQANQAPQGVLQLLR